MRSRGARGNCRAKGRKCFIMKQVSIGITHYQEIKENDCQCPLALTTRKVCVFNENSFREVKKIECSELKKTEQR